MAEKRQRPLVSASCLPDIMLGSRVCLWGPWFKAHYSISVPMEEHSLGPVRRTDHAVQVDKLADVLRSAHFGVSVGDNNYFEVSRSSGLTVCGRPDVVSWDSEGVYTVHLVKVGARSEADTVLVMLYMALLPYSRHFRGKKFEGSVIGAPGYLNIGSADIDDAFRKRISSALDIVGSQEAQDKNPSAECQQCDITSADCTSRVALSNS